MERGRKLYVSLLASALFCLINGCVPLDQFLVHDATAPCGEICQVVAAWNNEIILAPDPTRSGKPNPGIAGRVYLFGPNVDFPRAGDGSIVVDLFDNSKPGLDGGPLMLERWEFDPITLRKLLRQDTIGWGYTLFLPWGSYRPDVPVWNVSLKLKYQAANGVAHYSENPLTLNRPGGNNYRRTNRQETLGSMPQGLTNPASPNRTPQTLPAPNPVMGK